MSLYEAVYIARQDLTADDVDNLSDKLSNIISSGGGKVVSREYWGLRNLSYKINKNLRGHYVLLNIDSNFASIAEMKRIMGFDENIIRSEVFVVDEHPEGSPLMVSNDAKDYKAGKISAHKPSQGDLAVDRIIINN